MALTEKRDLRTGKPLWLRHGLPHLETVPFRAGMKADVIVVGTGISGALVADALLAAGHSVLAVDRRKPLSGSTAASTALLQSELDTPLLALQKKIGKSAAARAWLRSAQSVEALRNRVEDLRISCDLKSRTSLYLPGNVLGNGELIQEAESRRRIGLRSAYVAKQALLKLSGLNAAGAILTRGNYEADPVRLVAGLWRHFLKAGGRLVSPVDITGVEQSASKVRLETADGAFIHAKHVVFCTGYELMKFAHPKGYKVKSTWVLATKPQLKRLWPSKSLIWQAADPYLYLRTTTDGRIIAGGEDEAFSDAEKRDALLPKKTAAIARKAKQLFPQADFAADFAWTGSFGESPTGLPAIGPVPGLPRCYAVLGFGGNGITFSMLAAQLVSRHIARIQDPDADLFKL